MTTLAYEEKKRRLTDFLTAHQGMENRLGKTTSSHFQGRKEIPAQRLDVRDFNQVLRVNAARGYVEVEGMTPYARLVSECLKHNVMPAVVPQLKSTTVGGAAVGCGIESSSFRYGLVHETVKEMEILLGNGQTVLCTPNNEHSDLFYGFPNSYGTLGYALRLKIMVVPVKKYVKLTHHRYSDPQLYFAELARQCDRSDVDFVDGVVFSPGHMVITLGELTDTAPYTSDYTFKNIYYQSLRDRAEDYLTIENYIWRWDTDWFWCSKNLLAQHPLIRRLYGRKRLNSVMYTKIMRWNSRWKLTQHLDRLRGMHSESVIQDVEVPIENATAFLDFYRDNIKFMPVWICPTRAYNKHVKFNFYDLDPEKLYVNFGFWDVIRCKEEFPPGHHNREIEKKVLELAGIKSLYSDSYFTPDEFWGLYNKTDYDNLKHRYDPDGALNDIYRKCVLKE